MPPHWKRPWCWERLKAGEGDSRGWDGWMASPTQWTWVWASSGSWWWTGKLGMLQSMGSQKIRHDWSTELNWLIEESIVCGSTQKGSEQEWGDWRGDSNSLSFYIENSSLVLKNSHYKPLDPPIILMMTVFWLANSLGYILIYQQTLFNECTNE